VSRDALDWLLRGGLCGHETRAACPVCSRTESARVELDALLERLASAERDVDCGQAGAVCAAPCPGCLRHTLAALHEACEARDAAIAAREMWKALAVSAERRGHDAERFERVRALLVDATRVLEGER
jgi:hypothetical protein